MRRSSRPTKVKVKWDPSAAAVEKELSNPWDVTSLNKFIYYCCPECDHKSKDCDNFVEHAIFEHKQVHL